jgi:tripartite-type tricarboxylate transporter receptor subunit TctC
MNRNLRQFQIILAKGRSSLRAIAFTLLAVTLGAHAQEYPTKPIRFVTAGGADQLARIVGDEMSAYYGKAVYVEAKLGAGGGIATEFMMNAPPDGYNWLLTAVSYTGLRLLMRKPGDREPEPITMIAQFPFVLVVNNDFPVHSVKELVDYAKAHPGKLNFGSAGNGTPGHISGEMFKQMAKVDMVHVPYKSVAQALTDVISGQIQLMFIPAPAALPQIKAHMVRALAVTTVQRYKSLPDVPTVKEQGYPDYQYVSWNGVHAAPGTPPALLDRIASDIGKVIATPEARARADAAGFETVISSRKDFNEFLRADNERISRVIKNGNIRLD